MSEYLALVEQIRLPHWLILAGVAFVIFGGVGIILRGSRHVHLEAREVAPEREGRLPLPEPSRPTER